MEVRLLVQRTSSPKGKGKCSGSAQQQSGKDKKGVKCWNCNAQGHVAKDCPKKKQSLSAVQSLAPSSVAASGATGETTLNGFFLDAFEEEAELNSFESRTMGVLVTGTDSCAARSVVPAREISGYPVEKDGETGRVFTSATEGCVLDHGRQQILGTVDIKVRGLNRKSLISVYDMCGWASCRLGLRRHPENKLTGERTYFKFRNRAWELEIKVIRKRKPRRS